jgi:hypothetical protein
MPKSKSLPDRIADALNKGADAILKGLDGLLGPVPQPRPVPVRVKDRRPGQRL